MSDDHALRIERLEKHHDAARRVFCSGVDALDRYLSQQVTQDVRRRVTACFLAVDAEQRITGFYTLAATSVLLDALPAAQVKRLPRYPTVPAVLMGRLAVDRDFAGRGVGGALIADALLRTLQQEIAAYALIVDAKDDNAASFYRHHGFIALPDRPMTLFLPLATARTLLAVERGG